MQPNAHAKKLWRQWERFTRSGVKVNQKNYTSGQLLAVWALILSVLYLLLWVSRKEYGDEEDGQYKSKASFEADTGFWHCRHLIFCVSPGRAGSKYLRNVLDVAKSIVAEHEPDPKMTGNFLQQVILQGKRAETLEERARIKLQAIRDVLEGTSPETAYAETNHMFVKTYADAVLEKLGNTAKISIIFLHRPAKDTIWSQLRLGWFTDGHSGKNEWYYDANDVHESERQSSFTTNSSNRIDSLIGYNADVLQRGVELEREVKRRHRRNEWKHVHVYETLLMDISGDTEAGVLKLLSNLGLSTDKQKLRLLKQQDRNARDLKKDRQTVEFTIEDIETRLDYMKNKLPLLKQVMYD